MKDKIQTVENRLTNAVGTKEACTVLNNISRITLARWVKEKRIRGYKIGFRWFYFPGELLEDIKTSESNSTNL